MVFPVHFTDGVYTARLDLALHLRRHGSGRKAHHAQPFRCAFHMGRFGHHRRTRLGGAIVAPAFERIMRGTRADGDDCAMALLEHMRHRRAHPMINPLEVDIDCVAPCLWIALRQHRHRLNHARVANQDIKTAKPPNGVLHSVAHIAVFRDITRDRQSVFANI